MDRAETNSARDSSTNGGLTQSERIVSGGEGPGGIIAAYMLRNGPPSFISGFGAALTISLLAELTKTSERIWLIPSFGASCLLLFAAPHSLFAQPKNVVCGHLLSATIGLLVLAGIGHGAIACGLGVGMAIAAMQFTGTLHPPAAANPLLVILTHAGWSFLGLPVLTGAVTLVVVAWLYHRLVSGRQYPA